MLAPGLDGNTCQIHLCHAAGLGDRQPSAAASCGSSGQAWAASYPRATGCRAGGAGACPCGQPCGEAQAMPSRQGRQCSAPQHLHLSWRDKDAPWWPAVRQPAQLRIVQPKTR